MPAATDEATSKHASKRSKQKHGSKRSSNWMKEGELNWVKGGDEWLPTYVSTYSHATRITGTGPVVLVHIAPPPCLLSLSLSQAQHTTSMSITRHVHVHSA